MTRDPRHLVPTSCLPFVPLGAITEYQHQGVRVIECIDLSEPPERDSIPERLDVLPWAIIVLGERMGVYVDSVDALRPRRNSWVLVDYPYSEAVILSQGDDGYEALDGDDPDQPRRLVAAALRNVKPKVTS